MSGYVQKGQAYEDQNLPGEAVQQYLLALGCTISCEYYTAASYEGLAVCYSSLQSNGPASDYAGKALGIYGQYWIPDGLKERMQRLERIRLNGE